MSILSSKSNLQTVAKLEMLDHDLIDRSKQRFYFGLSIRTPATIRYTVQRAVIIDLPCRSW